QLSQLDRLVTLNEFQVNRPLAVPGQPATAVVTPGTVRAQMVAVVFQALPEPTLTLPGAPAAGAAAPPPEREVRDAQRRRCPRASPNRLAGAGGLPGGSGPAVRPGHHEAAGRSAGAQGRRQGDPGGCSATPAGAGLDPGPGSGPGPGGARRPG